MSVWLTLLKICKRFGFACIFLCLLTSSSKKPPYFYDERHLKDIVMIGDYIVRQGTGYEGLIITRLSNDTYSHIGLIVAITPRITIIHATTDDDPRRANQVIQSNLSEFIQPRLAHEWAIYRQRHLDLHDIDILVKGVTDHLGTPFVIATQDQAHLHKEPNDENNKGIYCSTLIADHLPDLLRARLHWDTINMPGLQGEVLYPSTLIRQEGSYLVYQERHTAIK